MKEHLFICGTLLPEFVAGEMAGMMSRLRDIGKGYVEGRLYDFGKYPGAVLDASSQMKVRGRVYELPNDSGVLPALDSYEEFDPQLPDQSLFVRKQTVATLDDGRRVQCWIYVYNRNPGAAPLIPDGDYQKYQSA